MKALTVLMGMVGLTAACGHLATAADVNDPHWGCYEAQPGHPTPAERTTFIDNLVPTAQEAERNGGPPAAGLLAMSALESGFGWTRTAVFANNLFGWKFVSAAGSGNRDSWTLACQPASDPNNRYVVFRDHRDSLAFVANRLKSNTRYGDATRQYHADRATGMKPSDSVARWIKGIADAGYNPFPDYPGKVLFIANDYLHPGPVESAGDSLYRYVIDESSAAATPTTSASPAGNAANNAAESAAAVVLARRLEKARYLSASCDALPVVNWPGYEGRNVRRCTYTVTSGGKTLRALVYLLNPSADNLTARIGYACKAVGLGDRPGCGRYLAAFIVNQNGAQFPVAGLVIERKRDAGGQGDDPVYLEFRDGVTVLSKDGVNFTDHQLSVEAMEHAARASLASTRTYARVANATRDDYRRAGGTEAVGKDSAGDKSNRWPAVIRENELRAQDTGRDELLRGLAIGLRGTLAQAK